MYEHLSLSSGNSFLLKIFFSDQNMLVTFSVYVCMCKHTYTHTHRCIEMVSVRSAVDFQCLLHLVCSGWMLWSRQACNYVTTSWQPDPTSLFYFIFCLFCNDLTVRGLRQTTVSQASPFPSKMAIIHLYCPQRNRLHHKYKSVFVRETLSK